MKDGIKPRVLVVCKYPRHSKEARVCKPLVDEGFDVKYFWKNTLSKSDLKDIDLVISIGGDGTALSASHYLLHRPLLPVNSAPRTSVGALTTVLIDDLSEKLKEIKFGKYKVEKLERIEVLINDKAQDPLALNEVFIANEKAYLISKYKIKFNGASELQRSSGLIFSTGTGSTAWFKSAGGKEFSPQSKYVKMLVREPFFGFRKIKKYKFIEKTVKENEEIKIIPLTDSILAVDSIREFKLQEGDEVRIRISRYPLLRIC